ncbi:hypothetical protein OEA41_004972 [Lepraria neglecta]|uniref:Uncharacterized protein n=1 Tax=Lepraria neglecta TaxID=209136 RepID=A0AAD9YYK3_9LECA|nr:hypothetical protein OEA41_004972 [Lepraria neglecta]
MTAEKLGSPVLTAHDIPRSNRGRYHSRGILHSVVRILRWVYSGNYNVGNPRMLNADKKLVDNTRSIAAYKNIAVEACKRDVRETVRDKDWKGLMDKDEDFRDDMMDIAAKKMTEEAEELESLKAKLDDVRVVLKRFRGVMEDDEE